ncbi:MAG: hypothetical protein JO287_12410 [Pseudonocardiales bacterium]|nr:hypothetical protein [Pseudonocardiales bacterium]
MRALLATAGLLATVVLPAGPAAAASEKAPGTSCTEQSFDTGECLTFWLDSTDSSTAPVVAAVRQQLRNGDLGIQRAKRFLATSTDSAVPSKTRTLLQDAIRAEEKTRGAGQRLLGAETAEALGPPDRGVGTVTGPYSLTLDDKTTYGACDLEGCAVVGEVAYEYRVGIYFYPEVSLGGEVRADSGPNFRISEHSCEVWEDIPNWWDDQVGTFSTCGTTGWSTSLYNILDQTITQGSDTDSYYYLDARICVKPDDPRVGTFCPEWETKRWYNPNSGSARFPQWNG